MHGPAGPALMLVALALAVRAGRVAAADAARHIEYRDDRLTVAVTDMPLADVLAEFGRQSGAEIRGEPVVPRTVTMSFDALPLGEGLQRLLGEQNFALRYAEGGRLAVIDLRGGPEEPRPPPPALTAGAAGTQEPVVTLPRRFLRHRPLPVPEQLAESIGSDTASFEQLFDAATRAEDGVVRAQAMMVTLSALERERGLRRALNRSLRGKDDASLGPFLQSQGGLEILEFFAAHSREPGLQKKAAVLLDQLRGGQAGPPSGS